MLVLLALCCTAGRPPGGADTAPDPGGSATACNGHDELCERRLDAVTFAGTHNSMSNADAGWMIPNQQHGLTRQLEDGIRALMLDTYEYNGEPYLCHASCELGAQPLAEGLDEIAAFLDTHPREVVLVIFEDHIPVEDTVAVFDAVGLTDRTWAWDGGTMPTLGQLVAEDRRLVIGAENSGPPPDWYHAAWDLFFDTPYDFWDATEFSCELNRGSVDNPLFLVNHWLSDPLSDESNAEEVNQADVLESRARRCAEEQGHPVNFLAVDFYAVGDLFEVVDRLNGFGTPSP
ncbi:MAG: hypothetical protein D6798_19770 [Deltaproteobacteria bacterium]|nr:MAG: hypothetical protein D6798_19770 [Deltaproteobacteria bacterium]